MPILIFTKIGSYLTDSAKPVCTFLRHDVLMDIRPWTVDATLLFTVPIRHKVDLIQLKKFELKLDFAQYIQYTGVRADCRSLLGTLYTIYRVTSLFATVDFVVRINLQP